MEKALRIARDSSFGSLAAKKLHCFFAVSLPNVIYLDISKAKNNPARVVFCCRDPYSIHMKYESRSAAETKKIAKAFAEELLKIKTGKGAFVVLLKGDLGAGKTTFIQGLMRGLGVKRKIVSPTFTLLRSYRIKAENFSTVHHFDCYRMADERELNGLRFKDMVKDPGNIILIEWPERVAKAIPRDKVTVSLDYGNTFNERIIEVK